MVDIMVFQYGPGTLRIAVCRLHFHQCAFTPVTHQKVNFQTCILTEEVKLSAHLGKNVGKQILEDSALIPKEIATEDICLGTILKH